MKFDTRKGDTGMVFDARGVKLPDPGPVYGDTETGEVYYHALDRAGKPIPDSFGGNLIVKRIYDAPLKIEGYVRGSGWGE